jgi:LmbE family N-acetylglucosaminyl deacetylase
MTADLSAGAVLLLSPHSDDIAYSLCGRLLADGIRLEACVMVTVFSISQFAPYANPPLADTAAITAFRADEDWAFARAVGLQRIELGLCEAPIRDGITNVDDLFTRECLGHPYLGTLITKLRPVLTAADWSEIYLPLGLGGHIDHLMLKEAVLHSGIKAQRVRFYEDLPYAGEMTEVEYHAEIARLAAGLTSELTPMDAWVERKLALLRLYSSQVAQKDLQFVLNLTARIGGERVWRLPQS